MTNRVRIIVAMGSVCALSNVGSADVDEPTDALLSNGIAAVAEAATGVTPASATSDSVDFENPVGATNTDSDGFSDDGFDFIHGPDSCIFAHVHWGRLSVFPRNGTNILAPHGDAIMTASDGSLFSLDQVDLAGFFKSEDPGLSCRGHQPEP